MTKHTYADPSARLRALTRFGAPADVMLLAQLGPSCALYVHSREYRARSQQPPPNNPFGLDARAGFRFFCDHLADTNRHYPIAQFADLFTRHAMQAVRTPIPHLVYLLMAAIETAIPGISDDVIKYWSSTPELTAEHRLMLGQPFSTSDLVDAYHLHSDQVDAAGDDLNVAEFLFGRSAYLGSAATAMITAPLFARNISAYALDKALAVIAVETKRVAMTIPFTERDVQRRALDAFDAQPDATVKIVITEEARKTVETLFNEPVQHCSDWFAQLETKRQQIDDVLGATAGDITQGVNERRRKYIRPFEGDSYQKFGNFVFAGGERRADPDDDIDDK